MPVPYAQLFLLLAMMEAGRMALGLSSSDWRY